MKKPSGCSRATSKARSSHRPPAPPQFVNPLLCPPAQGDDCAPVRCRWRCALDVVDELLRQPGAASGEETDRLLELRYKLRRAEDAEGTLRLFCELRLTMERRHYLAFFRMRRWLENHIVAAVRICPAAEARPVALKLDFYCVEAIRRVCLCAALTRDGVLLAPRLRFLFQAQFAESALTGSSIADSSLAAL